MVVFSLSTMVQPGMCFIIVFVFCLDKDSVKKPTIVGVESELIQNMLMNYSRYGRPIADVLKPVEVSISFYLTQLMSLVRKCSLF